MDRVVIYTDGSALGNPGPGGYGVLMFAPPRHRKEMSGGYRHTTNNRMELLAVIVALEALRRKCEVTVFSDSKYVVDAIEKRWVFEWEKKGFKGKKNPDLWRRFLDVYRRHSVRFEWIKGHADNPYNERCDVLAVAAAKGPNLKEDTGYEEVSQLKIEG